MTQAQMMDGYDEVSPAISPTHSEAHQPEMYEMEDNDVQTMLALKNWLIL